jgi:predicted methyltransferase
MKPANELLLSVVTPVYNEEEVVDRLAAEIISALSSRSGPWEVIAVNDGSRDATLAKLVAWYRREPRFKVIDLSRNFGHQRALLAGLAHASGDVIACIDGDLQDPRSARRTGRRRGLRRAPPAQGKRGQDDRLLDGLPTDALDHGHRAAA